MDRRDALKKLGMGGATVVGASVVLSSPAVAAGGTPTCAASTGDPAVTISSSGSITGNGGTKSVTITFSTLTPVDNPITCTCLGTPTPVGNPFGWLLAGTNPTSASGNSATWSGLATPDLRAYSFSVRVQCLDSGSVPVCAIWTGGGDVDVKSGSSASTITQPTGSLSNAPCA